MAHAVVQLGFIVSALLLFSACDGPEREVEQTVASLEDRADALGAAVDSADKRVASLEDRTSRVIQSFASAGVGFEAAQDTLQNAARQSSTSTSRYRLASEQFERAQQSYRVAAYSVIALAVTAALAQAVCTTRMSTSEFRSKYGITSPDVHVDHIWPRARGGIDSPLNYQPLDAHTNMSCGAGCLGAKASSAPASFAVAAAASVLGRLGCP
jgi:hypothetical protein